MNKADIDYGALRRDLLKEIADAPGIMYGDLTLLVAECYGLRQHSVTAQLAKLATKGEFLRVRELYRGRASYACYPRDYKIDTAKHRLIPITRKRKPATLPSLTAASIVAGVMAEVAPRANEDDFDDTAEALPGVVGEPVPWEMSERMQEQARDLAAQMKPTAETAVIAIPYGEGKVWHGTLVETVDLYEKLRPFERLR